MKLSRNFLIQLAVLGAAGLLAAAAGAQTPPAKPGAPGKPDAKAAVPGTNAPPVEMPIPVAVFEFTNVGVKDPFFPLSARLAIPPPNPPPTAITVSAFQLKALAGTGKSALATINNRTLAAGEEAEVDTATGPVKIQCVEIRESSVIIRVPDQPGAIELKFRRESSVITPVPDQPGAIELKFRKKF